MLSPHSHVEALLPPIVNFVQRGVELLVPRIVCREQVHLFSIISVPTGQSHTDKADGSVLKRLRLQQFLGRLKDNPVVIGGAI